MAYCRATKDNQAYAYKDMGGGYTCWCPGKKLESFNTDSLSIFHTHIKEHAEKGEAPQSAVDRIRKELRLDK